MIGSSDLSHRERAEAAEGSSGQYKQLLRLLCVCGAPRTHSYSQIWTSDVVVLACDLYLLELMAKILWPPMFHPQRQGCPLQCVAGYRRGKHEMFKLVRNFLMNGSRCLCPCLGRPKILPRAAFPRKPAEALCTSMLHSMGTSQGVTVTVKGAKALPSSKTK